MADANEDPLLKSSRREALVCLAAWLVATTYSVGYCHLYAYERTLDSLTFVLGFPDWIFWGLITPWLGCTLFSAWFCLGFMTDETLEDEAPAGAPDT